MCVLHKYTSKQVPISQMAYEFTVPIFLKCKLDLCENILLKQWSIIHGV